MSTRSFIAMETSKGFKYIYCHHDGYPSGVGATLYRYFNKRTDVEKLIDGGDFSSLYPDISNIERYHDHDNVGPKIVKTEYELVETFDDSWCDYLYVYTMLGNWKYMNIGDRKFEYFVQWVEENQEDYKRSIAPFADDVIRSFKYNLKESLIRDSFDKNDMLNNILEVENYLDRIKNKLNER